MSSLFSVSLYVSGNNHGTHFSTKDLESIGYHLCESLLDFCDEEKNRVNTIFLDNLNKTSVDIKL